MGRIFISYRRLDSEADAGRLYQTLRAAFGEDRLFKDVDNIDLGVDFREAILTAMNDTAALIVVIGPAWLELDTNGASRLANADDPVRMEMEAARQLDVPVIPVRVRRADMPTEHDLPAEVGWLAYRNAAELDHATWERDAKPLIEHLKRLGISAAESSRGVSAGTDPDTRSPGAMPTAARYRQLRKKLSAVSRIDLSISKAARDSLKLLAETIAGERLIWFAHTQGLDRTMLGDGFLAVSTDPRSERTQLVYVEERTAYVWDAANVEAATTSIDTITIRVLTSENEFSVSYNSGDAIDELVAVLNTETRRG